MIKVKDSKGKMLDVEDIYLRINQSSTTNYREILITSVYKGLLLIWNLVRSCFGSGVWVNTSLWSNTETWKNS